MIVAEAFLALDEPGCKNYNNPSPLLMLRRYLFCEYDRTVRPVSSHKDVTNVTIKLIPKILEFVSADFQFSYFFHARLEFRSPTTLWLTVSFPVIVL